MIVYGITMDFNVLLVRLGSPEMMACREVAMSASEAESRARELRNQNPTTGTGTGTDKAT